MSTKLKCSTCGNEKEFYRDIHLVGKIRVNNTGKVLKKIYDVKSGDLYEPIRCCSCNSIVVENGDLV